jgi:hypothetical protein
MDRPPRVLMRSPFGRGLFPIGSLPLGSTSIGGRHVQHRSGFIQEQEVFHGMLIHLDKIVEKEVFDPIGALFGIVESFFYA